LAARQTSTTWTHRLQLSNKALDASKKQVDELIKERNSLKTMHDLSKQTIETMEMDLKNYRVQLKMSGDDQVLLHFIIPIPY